MTNTAETLSEMAMSPKIKSASGMFGALCSASFKAVEGVIAVDKALVDHAWAAATGYMALGKDTMQAKSFTEALDIHVARAHARVETHAADTREIVELTRHMVSETYAPVKEAVKASRAKDAS